MNLDALDRDSAGRPSLEAVRRHLTAPGAPFEMETVEIRGIPTRVWRHAPTDLRAMLVTSLDHGERDYLVYEGERLTYRQHFEAVARFAQALVTRAGIARGDRVAVAARNYPEWSIAFWATTAIGAVMVPLNAWWSGEELAYGLADSGAKVLVADRERIGRILPHLDALGDLGQVVSIRCPDLDPASAPDIHAFSEAMPATLPNARLAPEDLATIFYSSGTTGRPKGVMGTHRNITSNVTNQAYARARAEMRRGIEPPVLRGEPRPPGAVLLSVPLFHVTGCHSTLVTSLDAGNKVVLMYKWDPGRALDLIREEGLTNIGGVPSMAWQLMEHPRFGEVDLSGVVGVAYGGAPAAPDLPAQIRARFPAALPSNGYGLTETSSLTSGITGVDYQERPDSVGQPAAAIDVRIVDPSGNDVATGEVGEVWIKGPNIVPGYWNRPDATAETFTDGWLHSGDIGRLDADGFLYIVDRAKDIVIRGGENVYCVEVENALFDHPAVIDAAVVGIPHRILGEEVGAVVQLSPGSGLGEDDLKAYVASKIAAFKVPVRILIEGEELPRNANGKIIKGSLRQRFAAEDG